MSAYTVDLEHIHVLVRAGQGFGADGDRIVWKSDAPLDAPGVEAGPNRTPDQTYRRAVNAAANDIGQMLVSANWRSVNYRYDENEIEPVYQYTQPRRVDREPVEILSAISCLEYQSSEFPEWADSEAARYLEALRKAQIWRLPGMSDAAWEISRDTLTLQETRAAARLGRAS